VHSSPNIGRVTKAFDIDGSHGTYWGAVKCILVLVGRPEGKRQLVRTKHRWEINIKMFIQEIELEGVHWIHVVPNKYQTRDFMKTVSLRFTQIAGNLNSLGTACSLFKNDSAPWTLMSAANIYPLIICMTDFLRTRKSSRTLRTKCCVMYWQSGRYTRQLSLSYIRSRGT